MAISIRQLQPSHRPQIFQWEKSTVMTCWQAIACPIQTTDITHMLYGKKQWMFNVVSTMKIWWALLYSHWSVTKTQQTAATATPETEKQNDVTHSVLFSRLADTGKTKWN